MRSRQLNISPDVFEALWVLGKTEIARDGTRRLSIVTPDEIADTVLRIYINDNYPELFAQLEHKQREINTLNAKLIEQLTKPT